MLILYKVSIHWKVFYVYYIFLSWFYLYKILQIISIAINVLAEGAYH